MSGVKPGCAVHYQDYDDDPRWILGRLSPMGKDLFERACTGLEDF